MNNGSSDQYTVIVGAGVAGLTAGSILTQAGEKCLLLEVDKKVGGLCRTYKLDDIIFDLGPHLLFLNPNSKVDRFLLDLLKDEKVVSNRFRFAIQAKGRYWSMPADLVDILFYYPWKYKREIIHAMLHKGKNIHAEKNTVKAMIEEKLGHLIYTDIFEPLMLKKSLVSPNKLHRDWPERVERDINNKKEIFSGFEHTIKLHQKICATLTPRYYYPLNGFETIARKLWEQYRQEGGKTILNCGPIVFNKVNNRITDVKLKGKAFPVKNIIWTASINLLNDILGVDIAPVHYIDTIIVLLTYNRHKRVQRRFVYTYHTDENSIFNRIYYPDHIYKDKNSPYCEGICAEINASPELQKASDKEIIDRLIKDVEHLGLFRKEKLRQYRLFRLKDCMPVYKLDYERRLDETFSAVHAYENLYSLGRRGGYFFCQTPAAVNQGIKIARHLLSEE